MEKDCLFCKIVRGEIPAKVVFEDEWVMVFPDIHPIKPVHLLIIPKVHVEEFVAVEDHELFKHLSKAIQQMIRENSLENSGYQIKINGGGHQDINHLHVHLIGPMGKPAA